MLWFENPVGVGFSYSTTNDYNTGDEPTAADNLSALQDFFAKYPEMGKRKLFLAGESYAGIYIPVRRPLFSPTGASGYVFVLLRH